MGDEAGQGVDADKVALKVLPFSVLAAGGESFIAMFPLHRQTVSPEFVGRLTTALLDTISDAVDRGSAVCDGDVLQAMAMALAVRAQVINAPPGAGARVAEHLVANALAAVAEARPTPAGRS